MDTVNSFRLNQGMALYRLAQTYPSLFEVILEQIQNALDKDVEADRIWIVLNYQNRYLTVRDNGKGTSVAKFNEALKSVASPGRKGQGSLGQFGLGLISPLGKCDSFVFCSCPAPAKGPFQEWTFRCREIITATDNPPFDLRTRSDLCLETPPPRGKTPVQWRSEMKLNNITTDTAISSIDVPKLIGEIQSRYGITMRRIKATISLTVFDKSGVKKAYPDICAPQFTGRELPKLTLQVKDVGEVVFHLYEAAKTTRGRNGQVLVGVGGDDFRFPFHYFARSVQGLLDKEVVGAISSGLFEGEIIGQRLQLHPERNTFVRDDAYLGFCSAIDDWYHRTGKFLVEETRNLQQERRFQELGLRAMSVLKSILEHPAHVHLKEGLKAFGRGTVGVGHTDLPKKQVVGEQDTAAVSTQGAPGIPREKSGEPVPKEKPDKPAGEKEKHIPLTVGGPIGRVRKVVKDSSFGLQFTYEGFIKDPGKLWRLEMDEGVLVFNCLHPLWVQCSEKNDVALMRLQEIVAMEVLTLLVNPESVRDYQRSFSDTLNPLIVTWILESDKVRTTKLAL